VPKVPYVAFLRVYEPLAAFPEPERSYWAEYATRDRLPGVQDELRETMASVLAPVPRAAPPRESGDAYVARVDGVLCVCPWRTRLRAWLALEEVEHWLMPQPVADAVLPPGERLRATEEYDRWRARNPDARPWIRSALWHVPVRWLALFDDKERIFRRAGEKGDEDEQGEAGEPGESGETGEPGESGESGETGEETAAPGLRYRTPMVRARQRVARGLRTVRRAMPEGPLGDALTDVGRWLEEFHPRSLVELDYGGLVHTIPEDELAEDHSAAEVAEGLAALGRGDLDEASRRYEELTDRWMTVRERQFAS
jgi:hypothetical protein